MGYSAGEGGANPSFDFFGRRDQQEPQAAIMEKRKKDQMATDSPFEVGGDSQQESPLLAALRSAPQYSAPQRSLRGGGGGRADYGDPRRAQGGILGGGGSSGGGGMLGGWQGGYGRNGGGGQQQFYGPRQGQGLALGSGGTGYNPNAPNPNATRGGYSV